eukprot:m.76326 g.76326  ORF g.76326 m.76326 type:complete len:785 (-) comp14424_c0_seq4:59-2413(-)
MSEVKRRVKVYQLNEDREWIDQGTGHVSSRLLSELLLEVRNEGDAGVMLETNVSKDTNFQRQGDTLILWDEPDGRHLALSFQDDAGCLDIWQQICQEKGMPSDATPGMDAEADLASLNLPSLPVPELNTLQEYADVAEQISNLRRESLNSEDPQLKEQATKACELLAELVYERHDIPKLLDLFEQCEDLEDTDMLSMLSSIFLSLLRTAEHAILNVLLDDDYLLNFIGTLEYDPSKSERQHHRTYLTETCQLQEVVPITAPQLKATIKRSYYLSYLKDVVFAGCVDDHLLSMLDSQVHFLAKDVIELVQSNEQYLKQILSLPTEEQVKEAVEGGNDIQLQQARFLRELFTNSAILSQQQIIRLDVLAAACDNGLVPCFVSCLATQREDVVGMATGALIRALELDALKLRPYIYDPAKAPARPNSTSSAFSADSENGHTPAPPADGNHWELVLQLVKAFKDSTQMANVLLLGQALGLLLDADTFDETASNFKSGFLTKFYELHGAFSQLVALFDDIPKQRATEAGQERLMITLELIGKWVLPGVHSYHIKNYILKHDVLGKATRVLQPGNNSLLAVAGARLLSLIIREGRNQFYNTHIVKKDLLRPLMERFRANGSRNNLLNSTVLSILASVQTESSSRLFAYIVKDFKDDLETLDYVETGQVLLEKLHDKEGASELAAVDEAASLGTSRRRFRPDGSMDRREEDYFNTDEDDASSNDSTSATTSMNASPTVTEPSPVADNFLQNAPRPRGGGLVDYDDDDDDEPVFKPSSKRPKMQFVLNGKKA